MIRTERVTEIPGSVLATLMPYAQKEFAREQSSELLDATKDKWIMWDGDTPCFIGGVYKATMLGNDPELWLLLCNGFNARRHLKPSKYYSRLLREGYPRLTLVVESSFRSGRRFAEVCGFKALGQITRRKQSYELYGVAT